MIVAIEKSLAAEGETYDADHRLVCGGLVETHIHLDKAYLIEQCPALTGRDISPVPYTSSIKPKLSTEEVYGRAERALKQCLMRGTTHIRTHVEVDPVIGMRGFDAIERLTYKTATSVDTVCHWCPVTCQRSFIDVELEGGKGREWSKVPLEQGWERVIVNNSCPKGLVEDLNEMKVIKIGMEKTKNAFPNVADLVRKEAFRRVST